MILAAKCSQLDAHQRFKREHVEFASGVGLGNVQIRRGLVITNLFVGEDDVNGLAHARHGSIQERVDPGAVAMHEASGFEGGAHPVEVLSADEDVDTLRVADGCLVDR